MAKHIVKCKYCGKPFDTNLVPFVKPTATRYAHKVCHDAYVANLAEDEKARKRLYDYINILFKGDCNFGAVTIFIQKYINEYKFTYNGILQQLKYHYEVKGNSIEKANKNIGIVPYVYQQAKDYYFTIWAAQQKNENKDITKYVPTVREVHIENPQRNVKKKTDILFSFFDEDGE